MRLLHKARRLSMRDWTVLLEAWALFPIMDLGLRLLPFSRLRAACRPRAGRARSGATEPPAVVIERCARLASVAGRYSPVRVTCLNEALVLSALLARRGLATTLRIGVARPNGDFAAHAWLEHDGRIILGEPRGDAFAPLYASVGDRHPT